MLNCFLAILNNIFRDLNLKVDIPLVAQLAERRTVTVSPLVILRSPVQIWFEGNFYMHFIFTKTRMNGNGDELNLFLTHINILSLDQG